MTRAEHLEWCKVRAMEYVNRGDYMQAAISMMSDLDKHDETRDHSGIKLGAMLMAGGHLKSRKQVVDYIQGFN